MRTREELESRINNAEFLSIDSDKDDEFFKSDTYYKFATDLARLMELVRKDFRKIGFEICVTVKECVRFYKKGNGAFLNYFNVALEKKVKSSAAIEKSTNIRPLASDKTERIIRKLLKFAKKENNDAILNGDPEVLARVAKGLNIPSEKIVEAIAVNKNTYTTEIETDRSDKTNPEKIYDILSTLDFYYKKQQERTKPLLSKLLTINFCEIIVLIDSEFSFVDKEIRKNFINGKEMPTQCEIAKEFDKEEASVSRTLSSFLEKVKQHEEGVK